MKVFLKVAVDVSAVESGRTFDPERVKSAVQEAAWNALARGRNDGFDHDMADEISLLVDYVEVADSDMEGEF